VPVYALGDQVPSIHPDAYVHPNATIIGDVILEDRASVWFNVVIRGDNDTITIGAGSNIQDGCVVHTTEEHHTIVGDDCVIGHLVHLEGCTIEPWCLIGVGSIVLHRVVVHSGAIVAANAVVLNDTVVPSGALAVGTPAVIKEGRARLEDIEQGVASYIERAKRFRTALRRID
jgi:carbonic anhydrase/acetyltransferase-like protein (isoleucine patch superfamily)